MTGEGYLALVSSASPRGEARHADASRPPVAPSVAPSRGARTVGHPPRRSRGDSADVSGAADQYQSPPGMHASSVTVVSGGSSAARATRSRQAQRALTTLASGRPGACRPIRASLPSCRPVLAHPLADCFACSGGHRRALPPRPRRSGSHRRVAAGLGTSLRRFDFLPAGLLTGGNRRAAGGRQLPAAAAAFTCRPSSTTRSADTLTDKRFQRGNLGAKLLEPYPGPFAGQGPELIG